jgi:hypothetical protein
MSGRQFVEAMARLCGYPGPGAARGWALDVVGMAGRAERKWRLSGHVAADQAGAGVAHDPVSSSSTADGRIDPIGRRVVDLFALAASKVSAGVSHE